MPPGKGVPTGPLWQKADPARRERDVVQFVSRTLRNWKKVKLVIWRPWIILLTSHI
jgi:hypothetical protein